MTMKIDYGIYNFVDHTLNFKLIELFLQLEVDIPLMELGKSHSVSEGVPRLASKVNNLTSKPTF